MKVESIIFHGAKIPCFQNEQGEVFFAVKPICSALGIDPRAQRDLIKNHEVFGKVVKIASLPSGRGEQDTLCLPLKYLPGWIFKIEANRVKPESKALLIAFQEECYDVLHAHFFGQTPASGPLGAAEMHVHNCMILQSELYLLQEKRRAVDKAINAKTKQIAQYNYRATPYRQQQSLFASRLQDEANIANF